MQVGAFFFACLQGETGEEWPVSGGGGGGGGGGAPPPAGGGGGWGGASPFLGRLRAELGRGDALRLASCENCCYNQNGKQECETQMGVEEKCPSSVWNI